MDPMIAFVVDGGKPFCADTALFGWFSEGPQFFANLTDP
jgi:hypothetical protein